MRRRLGRKPYEVPTKVLGVLSAREECQGLSTLDTIGAEAAAG